jgi:hypothetical protein
MNVNEAEIFRSSKDDNFLLFHVVHALRLGKKLQFFLLFLRAKREV